MICCPSSPPPSERFLMMWKFLLIFVLSIKFVVPARLEVSNDYVAIETIRENRNLIILFCKLCKFFNKPESENDFLILAKKGCVECKFEQSLSALRDELESTLNAKVLKLENSQLQRVYDFQKQEAALLFLRKGVGLLYPQDGRDSADDIFDFFSDNREPIVKELDDSNFEHLTQASTGSTTGDWLIQFYDSQCVDCNRLSSTWETVGAKLKTRLNVARVNRATKGIQTAKRFKVEKVPEFILIRQGKFYRYNLKQYDEESFVGFATSWFNRLTAEKVTTPATPFENLVGFIVERLKEMPSWKNITMSFINNNPMPVLVATSSFIILLLVFLFKKSKSKHQEKKVTKKEK